MHRKTLIYLVIITLLMAYEVVPEIYAQGDNGKPIYHLDPTWSPDGQQIAFVSNRSGTDEIWKTSIDGSQLTPLTDESISGQKLSPTWGAKQLAFISYDEQQNESDLWIMNSDGSNPINLTTDISGKVGYPAWSPDGQMVAFSVQQTTSKEGLLPFTSSIWTANIQTQIKINITPDCDCIASNPRWSPDGNIISFLTEDRHAIMGSQIHLYNIRQHDVFARTSADMYIYAEWSLDGQQIVTIRDGDIFAFDARLENRSLIIDEDQGLINPQFVPNSSLISVVIFMRVDQNLEPVFAFGIVDPQSTDLRILPDENLRCDREYAWSPDGQWVAIARFEDNQWDIWIMNKDGENARNLTGIIN